MSEANGEIIDKIRKLLRLARDSSSANEAANAAARAQRLMDEHRVASVDLDAPQEPIVHDTDPLHGEVRRRGIAVWAKFLAIVIARANGCATLNHGGALELVGRASDIAVSRYLFAYCAGEIERLTRRDGKGLGARWANSFRRGCVAAIRKKLEESRAEAPKASSGSTALTITERRHDEAQDEAGRIATGKARTPRPPRADATAFYAGVTAATREIDLRRGLESGALPESRQLGAGA